MSEDLIVFVNWSEWASAWVTERVCKWMSKCVSDWASV